MNIIVGKDKCCGCQACFNICPNNAISMVTDEKGFEYPDINQDKCIKCGLCKKVCPILNSKTNNYDTKVYAAMNNNKEERMRSSSGGIFSLLAKEILRRNGIVFGAAFDKDFNVYHMYIDSVKDINLLRGSKYVQSNVGASYKKVKEFLDEDRYVLFTGTSCQIEGLLNYLMKPYDKLYTQDIICHGVPSPKVWKKYLNYQIDLNKENIKDISFRNKDKSWTLFQMKILFDTKSYNRENNKDLYMKAFLKNVILRESCYNCSFKKKYRNSDITLADYWGIDNVHPNMNDNRGTSVVIINSKKGEELFNTIKEQCTYEESKLDYICKYNPAYIKSSIKDKKSDEFYNNLCKEKFDVLVEKHISKISFFGMVLNIVKKIIKKIIRKIKLHSIIKTL